MCKGQAFTALAPRPQCTLILKVELLPSETSVELLPNYMASYLHRRRPEDIKSTRRKCSSFIYLQFIFGIVIFSIIYFIFPGREAHHSTPTSVEAKNIYGFILPFPHISSWCSA
jgi:hypothetical protein